MVQRSGGCPSWDSGTCWGFSVLSPSGSKSRTALIGSVAAPDPGGSALLVDVPGRWSGSEALCGLLTAEPHRRDDRGHHGERDDDPKHLLESPGRAGRSPAAGGTLTGGTWPPRPCWSSSASARTKSCGVRSGSVLTSGQVRVCSGSAPFTIASSPRGMPARTCPGDHRRPSDQGAGVGRSRRGGRPSGRSARSTAAGPGRGCQRAAARVGGRRSAIRQNRRAGRPAATGSIPPEPRRRRAPRAGVPRCW